MNLFFSPMDHFFIYPTQTKISKLVYLLDLSNWKNKSSFKVLLQDNILIIEHYVKKFKHHIWWKLLYITIPFLYDCHIQWNRHLKSLILNSCVLSTFPALEIKKPVLVHKIIWGFYIILHMLLIQLLFH